jgi:nicotinate-nucleotide pyrophosphorylase (carboxylating)
MVVNMDVETFLSEDIETVDITSEALLGDEVSHAQIIAKEDCVMAGLEEARAIFSYLDLDVETPVSDGEKVEKGQVVLTLSGRTKDILAGERLALNFITRMSGITSETKDLMEMCHKINPAVKVAATRKTTPGFRFFEKKAVQLAGGDPHRFGLSDAFLIKDNHLKMMPSIPEAVKRAKESEWGQEGKIVEVEVESIQDAKKAAAACADIIMLDNMSPEEASQGYSAIKSINSDVMVEISGGITPENIEQYAQHADRISLGYLTHSIKAKDFSLEIIDKIP